MDVEEQEKEFRKLLEECRKEQDYQKFLEQHTRFIPREFVQNHGIGQGLVLRKLPFGADYKTDFFFFSKSTIDWNAVFIEIEKPSSRYFRGSTNEFHSDFQNALQQIRNWKAWFLSDQNKGTFLSTVSAIQVPRHMASNPTTFKYVLVLGRRSEYDGNEDRRRLVKACESENFKIISFDSLAEALSQKPEVSIGIRRNEFIDILTDEITSEGLYAWVEPTQLRVSKSLLAKLKNKPTSRSFVAGSDGKLVSALARAAEKVRVRPD